MTGVVRAVSSAAGITLDVEVVRRAQAGDRDAVAAIYRALAPAVIGYLRGAGSAEPEDVAGEVFVAVVQRLARFDGDAAAFRRWVFAIAHHRLIDERRRDAARRRLSPVEVTREHDGTDDAFERVVARLDASDALDALEALTEEQRSVVLLRTIGELSVADTATVLGKQPGAVKTLHRRALAALERRLGSEVRR